jgi:hypothetical protein
MYVLTRRLHVSNQMDFNYHVPYLLGLQTAWGLLYRCNSQLQVHIRYNIGLDIIGTVYGLYTAATETVRNIYMFLDEQRDALVCYVCYGLHCGSKRNQNT